MPILKVVVRLETLPLHQLFQRIQSPVRLVRPWPDHFHDFHPLVLSSDCRDSLRMRPTSGSGARRGPTGLHQHPHVAKNTLCVYDVQLLPLWRIPLLAVVLLLSLALRIGLLQRLPTSPCLSRFRNDCFERRMLCTGLFSQVGLLLGARRWLHYDETTDTVLSALHKSCA